MKKILHIVGGMDAGGTETMLMNLYRELKDEVIFDFISYYKKKGYYDDEIQSIGGKVINIDSPNNIGRIKSTINLYKIIRCGNYDIVHAHTLFNCGLAMIAAKFAGVGVRISHSHTNQDFEKSAIRNIYFIIMRVFIKVFSTDYISCSQSAGEYLFGKNIIKNKTRYKILPNYVNYEKILLCEKNNIIKYELGIDSTDFLIGHIGRFVEAKNHIFLIDVMEEIVKKKANVKLILVGEGPLQDYMKELVKKKNLSRNVFFLGIRKDIEKILNSLDLFVFPSIYEGLGLVMLEAQAAGLKCIVSEAIQPEADLNINLVNKQPLDLGEEIWANLILESDSYERKSNEEIRRAFENKKYDLKSITSILRGVYKIGE